MGGGSRERPKREQERQELKTTVGENITRLSNLEGVNMEVYKTVVLPKLLELITQSKDFLSQ
jgi:vacuolar protein sorting-associated protein 35